MGSENLEVGIFEGCYSAYQEPRACPTKGPFISHSFLLAHF